MYERIRWFGALKPPGRGGWQQWASVRGQRPPGPSGSPGLLAGSAKVIPLSKVSKKRKYGASITAKSPQSPASSSGAAGRSHSESQQARKRSSSLSAFRSKVRLRLALNPQPLSGENCTPDPDLPSRHPPLWTTPITPRQENLLLLRRHSFPRHSVPLRCLHNPGRAGNARLLVPQLGDSASLHFQVAPGRRIERAERITGFARAKPEVRDVKRGRCPSRTMLSAEPSEPFGLDCLAVSKHCPPQHPPRRRCARLRRTQPRLPSAVRTVPGYAVLRPDAPQAEDCRLRRQSSAGGQFANRSLAAKNRSVCLILLINYSYDILVSCVTLHPLPTLFLTPLKKNKKTAKVVRLMVSVKVKRLRRPLRGTLTDTNAGRKRQRFFFFFLFRFSFFPFFENIFK